MAEGRKGARRGRKAVWTQPEFPDFANGVVLAFDQAVAHTGYAVVRVHNDGIELLEKGQIQEPAIPGLKGWTDTLQRATNLALELEPIVMRWRSCVLPLEVVYEMPSVKGMRVDSALLGGLAVTTVAARYALPCHGVETQHAKVVLTGDRRSEKRHMKDAVLRYIDKPGSPFNEHIVDAIGLALTYLYDRQKETV